MKACERQLAYLVTVANSLFSYGMPAGMIKNNRSSARRASSQDYNVSMGGMAESYKAAVLRETELQQPGAATAEQPRYLDFQIVGKLLYLGAMTNQLRQNQSMKPPELELEASLLSFAKVFKNHVLTDSRILMLCSTLYQEQHGEVEGQADNLSDVDSESSTSLQMLAQLCGR